MVLRLWMHPCRPYGRGERLSSAGWGQAEGGLEGRAFTAAFLYDFPPDSAVSHSRAEAGKALHRGAIARLRGP